METNERICWRILIFCKYCKLFSLRFRYCLWFLLRHQCLFGWRTVVALIIIYNTKRNTENAWEHKMHETIYTFVMVIFIAAAVATAIPSLHGSNTHKRCYIWKYELQIHLNACSKSYYSFFLQARCLRDNAKCLIRISNFPHFSLRLKGQAHSLDYTEYHDVRSYQAFTVVTNILICNRTFFASLRLCVSRFHTAIKPKNIITIRLQGKNTHTHDISQGHTFFL